MPIEFKKGRALGSLNLTPLIDVVFLLLIFFLVATEFAQEEARSIPVKLPEAAEARPITARLKDIYVSVDEQGGYYLGGTQVSAARLMRELVKTRDANPGQRQTVIIRGHLACRYQAIVTVMDICNRVGFSYRAATTEPAGS